MFHFECDYKGGALPEVLEALTATNGEQTPGYGADIHTGRAKELIRSLCGAPDAEVYLAVGGTQANAMVLDALLGPSEGVVAAETAHIGVHEAGAIEASGHKVLTLGQHDGKIAAADLADYLRAFYADDTWPHMVIPGAVYISFPTELGTLYTRDELRELAAVCRRYELPLYVDGARLGYGLAAASCDVTLADLAAEADVFYLGGTKQGLLMGEAVVARKGLLRNFFTVMKRHGGVLAKGRLLGVQFCALLSDDLYLRSSRWAVELAMRLREGFAARGYAPLVDSPTNQQFFRLPNALIDRLSERASFGYWGPRGAEASAVRFVTSWATTREEVDGLVALLDEA